MIHHRLCLSLLLVVSTIACETSQQQTLNTHNKAGAASSAESNESDESEAQVARQKGGHQAESDKRPRQTIATITDRQTVETLEDRGFSLGERLGVGKGVRATAALAEHLTFDSIAQVIERDLQEFRRQDPKLGVAVAGHPHRLFDASWLRSKAAYFELVGVVSRLDRRPMVDKACGEVRLVYRLAYQTTVEDQPVASRLPLTLAVDWLGQAPTDESCSEVARRWLAPSELKGQALAKWLSGDEGPLDAERLTFDRIDRVLLNMQSIRWPSAVHPSLGGHAEYVLRSFEPTASGKFEPAPLENTPDVTKISRDKELRRELIDWLKAPANVRRIDAGTMRLPRKFLATRAISAAPRGLARRANLPFSRMLSAKDVGQVEYQELSRVRSAPGLIRRLDDHTCTGCHQGRAIAGFHLLGQDSPEMVHANALAVSLSAHGLDEVRRRTELIEQEASLGAADYARPFSERDAGRAGLYGTPCGLTDEPTFAKWDCVDGLECRPYDTSKSAPHIGVCLPTTPQVGDPCRIGKIRSRADPVDDRVYGVESRPCPAGAVCNVDRVGFPGGMCTTTCSSPGENGRCGAIAVLDTFNACLARNTAFDRCLTKFVTPAGLRSCDRNNPCRHDYICAQNADAEGVCLPPYFLFQMRVDGHPN
jgi:hypothetical protein